MRIGAVLFLCDPHPAPVPPITVGELLHRWCGLDELALDAGEVAACSATCSATATVTCSG